MHDEDREIPLKVLSHPQLSIPAVDAFNSALFMCVCGCFFVWQLYEVCLFDLIQFTFSLVYILVDKIWSHITSLN